MYPRYCCGQVCNSPCACRYLLNGPKATAPGRDLGCPVLTGYSSDSQTGQVLSQGARGFDPEHKAEELLRDGAPPCVRVQQVG